MQVKKQLGFAPEGLEPPTEFPDLLEYVWVAFLSLSRRRHAGFNGPQPITPEQILAWKTLHEFPLRPWEVEALEALDDIYMRVAYG